MCTYVIGDIHGCYDLFIKLLSIINYQDDDEIICIGDYIDRGTQNYKMLKWLESFPYNFLLIRGNHEEEFIANIDILNNFADKLQLNKDDMNDTQILYKAVNMIPEVTKSYFDYYKTIGDLVNTHSITLSQLINWANIMKQMPYKYTKTINNKKYIITHAGYKNNSIDYYIYAREKSYINNGVVIAGHTPTILKKSFSYNNGNIYKDYNTKLNSIYINIDCGCVYRDNYKNAKLACIRLEDMKEFYI